MIMMTGISIDVSFQVPLIFWDKNVFPTDGGGEKKVGAGENFQPDFVSVIYLMSVCVCHCHVVV